MVEQQLDGLQMPVHGRTDERGIAKLAMIVHIRTVGQEAGNPADVAFAGGIEQKFILQTSRSILRVDRFGRGGDCDSRLPVLDAVRAR